MPRVPGVSAVPRGNSRDRCGFVTLRSPPVHLFPGSDMLHSRPRRRTSGTAAVPADRSCARIVRSLVAGVVAGTVVLTGAAPAGAAPTPPPPNPSDEQIGQAQSAQEAAAAEVGRIGALVAQAQSQLEGYAVQAEAAGAAYLAAEEALLQAQAEAERTAAELQAATEAVAAATARIAGFSRDSYMSGNTLSTAAALLDAEGPADLIQRAAMLDYVSANHLDVLGQLEVAQVRQANADSAARAARDRTAEAEAAAAAAKATADQQLAAQRAAYDEVAAQKATYEQPLMDTPRARSHGTGSVWPPYMAPEGCTSKCRCGPVDWPRLPTSAMSSPATTRSPARTK